MSSPSRESSISEAKSLGYKYHDGEWVPPHKQGAKSKALKKKLNPAQSSMHKLLHSVNSGGRRNGEAPLQHLKRLIK